MQIGEDKAMQIFEDGRVYDDTDVELDLIAKRTQRAQWRHKMVGPAWIKCGRRVKYLGRDLNDYLDQNRVCPGDAA